MNTFVISIGSNLPDGQRHVEKAIEWLRSIGHSCESSSIYSTPSINGDGTLYFNAVLRGIFPWNPEAMSERCKDYEASCGRIHIKGMPVIIDLDVVMFNGMVLRPKDASRSYFKLGYSELL